MKEKRTKKRLIADGCYIGTYIAPEAMQKIERIAAREMRSKAQMLRIFIDRGLSSFGGDE